MEVSYVKILTATFSLNHSPHGLPYAPARDNAQFVLYQKKVQGTKHKIPARRLQ